MSRLSLLIGGVAFLAVIAGYIVLTGMGKDTGTFFAFVLGASGALLPGIASLAKQKTTLDNVQVVQDNVQTVQEDIQTVKDQTNGPLTKMFSQVDTLSTVVSDIQVRLGKAGI